VPHNAVAHELGINSVTVATWRKEGLWDVERDGIERGLIEDSFGARRLSLARICKLSVDQLERGLKHLADRNSPPTLAEAEKISIIVSNLDKILRLDMGKATENIAISAQVAHTVEEVRDRIAADPILGAVIQAGMKPKEVPPLTVVKTVHVDEE
jgi:hypothetical protein